MQRMLDLVNFSVYHKKLENEKVRQFGGQKGGLDLNPSSEIQQDL